MSNNDDDKRELVLQINNQQLLDQSRFLSHLAELEYADNKFCYPFQLVLKLGDVVQDKTVVLIVERFFTEIPISELVKIPTPLYPPKSNSNNSSNKNHWQTICLNHVPPLECLYKLLNPLDTTQLLQVCQLANYLAIDSLMHNAMCAIACTNFKDRKDRKDREDREDYSPKINNVVAKLNV